MKKSRVFWLTLLFLILALGYLLTSNQKFFSFLVIPVLAHCDTMDGPVIKAAKKALDTGNVNLILIWVQKKDEAEIKKSFEKTLAVRKLNPRAQELADQYFFETLVRLHRAGEGAPYTGIKPAGSEIEPGIALADKAVETGDLKPVLNLLTATVKSGLEEKFHHLIAKKNFNQNDVALGRQFVKAYVDFIHYVEGTYEEAKKTEHEHHH